MIIDLFQDSNMHEQQNPFNGGLEFIHDMILRNS